MNVPCRHRGELVEQRLHDHRVDEGGHDGERRYKSSRPGEPVPRRPSCRSNHDEQEQGCQHPRDQERLGVVHRPAPPCLVREAVVELPSLDGHRERERDEPPEQKQGQRAERYGYPPPDRTRQPTHKRRTQACEPQQDSEQQRQEVRRPSQVAPRLGELLSPCDLAGCEHVRGRRRDQLPSWDPIPRHQQSCENDEEDRRTDRQNQSRPTSHTHSGGLVDAAHRLNPAMLHEANCCRYCRHSPVKARSLVPRMRVNATSAGCPPSTAL